MTGFDYPFTRSVFYHPRKPKEWPLWNLLNIHYESFEQHHKKRFEKEYGFFRFGISDVVRAYLKCGDRRMPGSAI